MGAQWVHGVHSDNSVFNFAKKYGLLHENMARDGLGDMNHESFELENVYLKGGELMPEKFAVMAGEIYTKICSNWGNFADCQKNYEEQSINESYDILVDKELKLLKGGMITFCFT